MSAWRGVRDGICHLLEQILSKQVFCFQSLVAVFPKNLNSYYLGPMCENHARLSYIFFGDRSVPSINGTSLNRLSDRIVKGYNYEPYPFIMILSSKCNFWNDSEFRIYVHVKICLQDSTGLVATILCSTPKH